MENSYDVVTIGSGPAGEGTAIMVSKLKQRILVVEKHAEVGGGCTHWGTIPSKAIRNAILGFTNLAKIPVVGRGYVHLMPSFTDFLRMANTIVESQVQMRQNFYNRNYVEVKHGTAQFINKNTIKLISANGNEEEITSNHFVIATGSRPHHPQELDFKHPLILDSDKVLSLKNTPRSVTIFGAGVIGAEYACMFRNVGVKVNLINTRERVMDFLDQEISEALNYRLREQGVVIRNCEEFSSLSMEGGGVVLNLKSGKRILSDYLFWAQGRQGNVESLNLENIGITTNNSGRISVDDNYRTKVENIFAVGDVAGWPSLAGAAYDQGRHAAEVICQAKHKSGIRQYIPTGIYTSPEISCIGRTEKELTDANVPYEVGIAHFRHLAKAQMLGEKQGMLKLLFHRETLQILGIHCFGRQATEIIHIGQAIMMQSGKANTIRFFVDNTFNYPTMAEAYRVASLNGINRIVDKS